MKRLLVILAAIGLFLVGGFVAYASIPGPTGVINGCYKTSDPGKGVLGVIDSTQSCPSGYTALNWNQTGPAGATGATGPAGGLSGYEVVYSSVNWVTGTTDAIAPGAIGQYQPLCPTGKVVTGGGYTMNNNDYSDKMIIRQSYPYTNGNYSWLIIVHNTNDIAYSGAAYAVCVNG